MRVRACFVSFSALSPSLSLFSLLSADPETAKNDGGEGGETVSGRALKGGALRSFSASSGAPGRRCWEHCRGPHSGWPFAVSPLSMSGVYLRPYSLLPRYHYPFLFFTVYFTSFFKRFSSFCFLLSPKRLFSPCAVKRRVRERPRRVSSDAGATNVDVRFPVRTLFCPPRRDFFLLRKGPVL